MNICGTVDATAIPGRSAVMRARAVARAVRRRVADAIVSYGKSRAASRLAPLVLDSRTLRDIGLTPLGMNETALTEGNEANDNQGGQP